MISRGFKPPEQKFKKDVNIIEKPFGLKPRYWNPRELLCEKNSAEHLFGGSNKETLCKSMEEHRSNPKYEHLTGGLGRGGAQRGGTAPW